MMKLTVGAGAIALLTLAACTGSKSSTTSTGASNSSNQQYMQAKVALTVSQGASTLYSDSSPNSSLQLVAGQQYNFNLNVQNAPTGTQYVLVMTQNGPSGTTNQKTQALVPGDNTVTVTGGAIGGAYNSTWYWSLQLAATGYVTETKSYTAQVSCPNPNFSATGMTAGGISVTAGSGQNLYNFSASGAVPASIPNNGTPPYYCGWDLTGVGILDTSFGSCAQTLDDQYVNYVGTRTIGLIVQDSCGNSVTLSSPQNLQYTLPMGPGNVFITGQTSMATNASHGAATDPRDVNVNYMATNQNPGHDIVQPNYTQSSPAGTANASFAISSFQSYGQNSSVQFGVSISLTGLADTLVSNPANAAQIAANSSSTINTSHVALKSVSYITDQNGGLLPSQTYSSSSCTLSNVQASVKDPGGEPCTNGSTGDYQAPTVEVSGTYTCASLADSAGETMRFTGTFDGYVLIVDNCSGGTEGGGGIVPIQD
jgi:hypothetical protein